MREGWLDAFQPIELLGGPVPEIWMIVLGCKFDSRLERLSIETIRGV